MAGGAARRDGALQWRVAGKAIVGQTGMGRDQRPWGQHWIGVDKGEGNDARKVGGDDGRIQRFMTTPRR